MASSTREYLDPIFLSKLANMELVARCAVEGFFSGLHPSPFQGFSVEYSDHREYHEGDEVKFVDWKVFARSDRLYIKRFHQETNTTVYLLLDTSRSMAFAGGKAVRKIDYASFLAAALSYLMLKQCDSTALVLFAEKIKAQIPPASRRTHLTAILRTLGDATVAGRTNLAAVLHAMAETTKRRGLIVLISDLLDDEGDIFKGLAHLKFLKHDVIVFHVMDRQELHLDYEGSHPVRGPRIEGQAAHVPAIHPGRVPAAGERIPRRDKEDLRQEQYRLLPAQHLRAARQGPDRLPRQAKEDDVSFLAWTFLFGALAVIGPIVAHLLSKPRFRRVPFTMLRFLRAGQSHSHSRRRLRDLLILLLRCAIVVLIAILFAQPVLHVKATPKVQKAVIHLALDDSMSMAYRDGSRTLFERMIEKALDHVRQAPEDAAFNICGLASGRSSQGLTKSEAITAIKQLTVVSAGVRLADFFSALGQAGRAAGPDAMISAVLLSDFTPSILREFEQIQTPATVEEIYCEPIMPDKPAENTAIVAARVAGLIGDTLNLDVTVAHYGPTQRECTVTAGLPDHRSLCKQELSLAPGQHRAVRLQMGLSTGLHRPDQPCLPIELSVSQEDGLAEDDTFRIAVYVPRATQTNVVLVHRAEETFLFETAIQALSNSGSLERLSLTKVPQGRLTTRDLDGASIAVFSSLPAGPSVRAGDLKAFAQRGGRLIFFTAGTQDLETAKLLSREGLLAVQPQRWVQAITYPEPRPCTGVSLDLDEQAARSLSNYRLDQVALKGYWLCQPAAQAQCLCA